MFLALFRDSFNLILFLSIVLHACVISLLSMLSDTLPRLIPPQRGYCSISLQAMRTVDCEDTHQLTIEEVSVPTPTLAPLPPPELLEIKTALPEVPLVTKLSDLPPPQFDIPKNLEKLLKEATEKPPKPPEEKPREPAKKPEKTPEEKPREQKVVKAAQPIEAKAPVGPVPSPASRASEGTEVDELPRKHPFNPLPPYPVGAFAAGLEGRVLLRVTVGADGWARAAVIEETSGINAMDESALDTVLHKWQFYPAQRHGRAIEYKILVPVRFEMRDRR